MKNEYTKKQYTKPFQKSSKPFTSIKRKEILEEKPVYKRKEISQEKPVYKGKEDRLSGKRSRNETRVFSGYAPRTKKPTPLFVPKDIESKQQKANSKKLKAVSDTSWGGVADWYNNHLLKNNDTYHAKVVFPNLLRLLGDVSGKKILDLACGQGIFSEQLRDLGAFVTGVDAGKELIKIAEEGSKTIKEKGTHKVSYFVASADDLFMLKNGSFDIVVCVLALQNIDNLQKTVAEIKRVLTPSGRFIIVLNHPSFRNPKETSWGYNEAENKQYRRVDEYMSESHVRIDMTPGSMKDKKFTVSFHRPLQMYVKVFIKNNFVITHLEEWISHRESEKGPRKQAEDKARKEIPLFMCIEGQMMDRNK